MRTGIARPLSSPVTIKPEDLLRKYLQAYWLRPENALWMTLRSVAWSSHPIESPAVDLCCGDGIFSFLHCGGELDAEFDVFASLGHLEGIPFRSGVGNHVDMFDHASDDYRPTMVSAPDRRIDVGTDLKSTLLHKAGALGFYGRLIEHDHEKTLPFPDDEFQTVYCNAAYWVRRIDSFLAELCRVTHPTGRIVLQVKLASMADYTMQRYRPLLGERFLELLGRGRLACWPSLASQSEWEHRFQTAGLDIEACEPFVTATHAHIWDVGLRPLAPVLVKMTQALTPSSRASIKREWVDIMQELCEPFCNSQINLLDGKSEPAEIQYCLRPRTR